MYSILLFLHISVAIGFMSILIGNLVSKNIFKRMRSYIFSLVLGMLGLTCVLGGGMLIVTDSPNALLLCQNIALYSATTFAGLSWLAYREKNNFASLKNMRFSPFIFSQVFVVASIVLVHVQ